MGPQERERQKAQGLLESMEKTIGKIEPKGPLFEMAYGKDTGVTPIQKTIKVDIEDADGIVRTHLIDTATGQEIKTIGKTPPKSSVFRLTPEESKQLGKQLVDGDITPTMISPRQRVQALIEAKKIDPAYRAANAQLNFEALRRFTSTENSQSQVQKIQLIGTVQKHFDTLDRLSKDYARYDNIPFNKLKNSIGKNLGDEAVSKLETASTEIISQLNQIFAGSSVTSDSRYQEILKSLNPNLTVGQLSGNIEVLREFLNNREIALKKFAPILPGGGVVPGSPNTDAISLEDYLQKHEGK